MPVLGVLSRVDKDVGLGVLVSVAGETIKVACEHAGDCVGDRVDGSGGNSVAEVSNVYGVGEGVESDKARIGDTRRVGDVRDMRLLPPWWQTKFLLLYNSANLIG